MLGVADRPLPFEGESAGDQPIRNIIWFHGAEHTVIGAPAPTLADLDAVAVIERSGDETRVCTGYTDDRGLPQPDVQLRLATTVVTVYARRTGTRIASQSFPPIDECPRWLSTERGRRASRPSPLPAEAIGAWLEAQVAPQPT